MGYSKQEVLEILRRGFIYKLEVRYFHDKTYNDVGVMKGRGINVPTTHAMYKVVSERVKDRSDGVYVQVDGRDVYIIDPEFVKAGYTIPERMRVYINTESSLYRRG